MTLNEVMKPFFDELNIDPIEFNYNNNEYISKESFSLDENEEDFYMVIKLYNNIGTVIIGQTDGIRFFKDRTLGQIVYNGSGWENI